MLSCFLFVVAVACVCVCVCQTPSTGLRHPSTTAVFSYARGSRKLSANEQCFVGAQTVVVCYKQLKYKQGVSFIAEQSLH